MEYKRWYCTYLSRINCKYIRLSQRNPSFCQDLALTLQNYISLLRSLLYVYYYVYKNITHSLLLHNLVDTRKYWVQGLILEVTSQTHKI